MLFCFSSKNNITLFNNRGDEMRKKIVLVAAFLFFLPVLTFAGQTGAQEAQRKIQVCVLHDRQYPVEQKIIDKIVDKAFEEYKEEAGIEFLRYEFLQFDYDIKEPSEKILVYAKNRCSKASEVRIVFSSFERIDITITKNIFGKDSVEIYIVRGITLSDDGLIIIYNTAARFNSYDLGGNRSAITTLKHEIGHLFGLKHADDTKSFMYKESSDSSFGRWIPDVKEILRKNKYKKWY